MRSLQTLKRPGKAPSLDAPTGLRPCTLPRRLPDLHRGPAPCPGSSPPSRNLAPTPASTPSHTPSASASASASAASRLGPLTQRLFAAVDRQEAEEQAGGAGGRTTLDAFLAADETWKRLREQPEGVAAGPEPQFVRTSSRQLPNPPQYDVVVCGGTLGIFAAAALAKRGLKVAVVERGPLRGRTQEWNISRKELYELEHVGVATREELEACVAIEFNPVRVGFAWEPQGGSPAPRSRDAPTPGAAPASTGGPMTEVWTRDILNLGVRPAALVERMRLKLESYGGSVYERTAIEGVTVTPNGASLSLRADGAEAASPLTARLVVDCMGHFSPIVRQIRWGQKPDGVCLVVGGMGSGFPHNTTADVILTNTPLQPQEAAFNRAQYFWEAFPAASGRTDRTTYMFTYLDAAAYRPPLAAMMEDYCRLMPQYQGVAFDDIDFKRVLFGFFPTFKNTPLQPAFDRVIQIGDASGLQSPLSFGGFGALTRHLARLNKALSEALEADLLDKASLGRVAAYNPGLSSSWMMQRAMSVRQGDAPTPDLINRMLAGNFRSMQRFGDPVMKPFLQDVIQFGPMMTTLTAQMFGDPASIPRLISHVGPGPLLEWVGHMASLGAYTALHSAATAAGARKQVAESPVLTARERFTLNRLLDAWEYGSGLDYKL
ncbi:hypothetical protein HYH03_001824 [Edaphochlamys debaryana]|uniref:Uncharacterized protein n=1 Tax=Edaphochlamys debaryana TaxID=47281 RepID=A0A836C4K2_9CHLO|nr:hypothetical protein HYH03_001824 [Edaphochlamys debaryana]|eukprot:KAG2500246.1 hypothetical protein HYH03_001824 [Edaphochlamys debaryana]